LEKLATIDKATILVERRLDGKMRVTSGSWVILRDQVLELLTLSASFGGLEWRKKPKILTRHCKKRPRPEAFSPSHAKRTRLVVIAEATPMPNITKLQTRQPDM
jgi:hypothetical protein